MGQPKKGVEIGAEICQDHGRWEEPMRTSAWTLLCLLLVALTGCKGGDQGIGARPGPPIPEEPAPAAQKARPQAMEPAEPARTNPFNAPAEEQPEPVSAAPDVVQPPDAAPAQDAAAPPTEVKDAVHDRAPDAPDAGAHADLAPSRERDLPPLSAASQPVDPAKSAAVFEKAKEMIAAGNVADAATLLEEYLKVSPGDAVNRGNLVHIYVETGKLEDAEFHLRFLAQTAPSDAKMWAHLGRVQAKLGKLTQAAASLAAAWQLDGNDIDLALDLARLYLKLSRPGDARPVLEQALKVGKRESEVLLELANVLVEAGEYKLALDRFRKLQKMSPTYETALSMATIAARFDQCGDVADALAGWEKQFADERPHLLLATCALKDNALDRAETQLKAAVEKSPDCYQCALKLGDVYFQGGRWADAATLYDAASKLDLKDYQPFFQLGKALANGGKHAEAAQAFARAAERKPGDPDILYAWGLEANMAGDKGTAWKVWGQLDERAPDKGAELKKVLLK
jgi:tetratricopeptide (TPR) repeat protein